MASPGKSEKKELREGRSLRALFSFVGRERSKSASDLNVRAGTTSPPRPNIPPQVESLPSINPNAPGIHLPQLPDEEVSDVPQITISPQSSHSSAPKRSEEHHMPNYPPPSPPGKHSPLPNIPSLSPAKLPPPASLPENSRARLRSSASCGTLPPIQSPIALRVQFPNGDTSSIQWNRNAVLQSELSQMFANRSLNLDDHVARDGGGNIVSLEKSMGDLNTTSLKMEKKSRTSINLSTPVTSVESPSSPRGRSEAAKIITSYAKNMSFYISFAETMVGKIDDLVKRNKEVPSKSEFEQLFPTEDVTIDKTKFAHQRHSCAYEILTSEQSYVRDLQVYTVVFGVPFQQAMNAGELPSELEDLIQLIRAAQGILKISIMLLEALKDKFKHWSEEQTVGDTLLGIIPFLKMYRQYTEKYKQVLAEVARQNQRKGRFSNIVAQAHELKRMEFQSYLILCVQRVMRYEMLSSALLKNTPPEHPDYVLLGYAIDEFKGIAGYADEAINVYENMKTCVRISEKLDWHFKVKPVNILEAHRKFIHQGTLKKQCRRERKDRQFFLFNDMLMYAHTLNLRYHVDLYFSLETITIADIPDDEHNQFGFQIRAHGKSFAVYANTLEDKTTWMDVISKALQERLSIANPLVKDNNTEQAAVWQPDEATKNCMICAVEFSVVKRRHHCRNCGNIVCGDCSKHEIIVPGVDKQKPQRVCDKCYMNHG